MSWDLIGLCLFKGAIVVHKNCFKTSTDLWKDIIWIDLNVKDAFPLDSEHTPSLIQGQSIRPESPEPIKTKFRTRNYDWTASTEDIII